MGIFDREWFDHEKRQVNECQQALSSAQAALWRLGYDAGNPVRQPRLMGGGHMDETDAYREIARLCDSIKPIGGEKTSCA